MTRRGHVIASAACLTAISAAAAGCGSAAPARPASAAATPPAIPLDTTTATAGGTWATVVMGGSAAQYNNFWQLFLRPAGGSTWKLVTPPGTADNGGLVLAPGAGPSAIGAFRPSQDLTYTPLIQTSDGGQAWSALSPLDAPLASTPNALAVEPAGNGQLLALTTRSTAEQASPTAARWTTLASVRTLAATPAGRQCGLRALTAADYLPSGEPLLAGACSRPGTAGIFADQDGTWQAAGPALPPSLAGPDITVLRLLTAGNQTVALLRASTGHAASVLAAWSGPAAGHWTISPALKLHGVGLTSASFGPAGSVAIITGGGTAAVISSSASSWQALPALPPGTATLALSAAGPAEALAVHGSTLTVWQLAAGGQAWTRAQVVNVPIQYGSSG
jgi:hypothetical protein